METNTLMTCRKRVRPPGDWQSGKVYSGGAGAKLQLRLWVVWGRHGWVWKLPEVLRDLSALLSLREYEQNA